MTRADPFMRVVDELGEDVFGIHWLRLRATVHQWIADNPERLYWLTRRLRRLVREGRV